MFLGTMMIGNSNFTKQDIFPVLQCLISRRPNVKFSSQVISIQEILHSQQALNLSKQIHFFLREPMGLAIIQVLKRKNYDSYNMFSELSIEVERFLSLLLPMEEPKTLL